MNTVNEKERKDKFISYPTDTLLGIIDQVDDSLKALQALVAAGFADEIQAFHGEEGAYRIDASGAKHGLLAQLRRLHQKTTVERDHAEQYELAVEQGHCVIAVHTSDAERRSTALAGL